MRNNPDWRVSFSLKRVLFWVAKMTTVLILTFCALTLYAKFMWDNPAAHQWLFDSSNFVDANIPSFFSYWFYGELSQTWPLLVGLLLLAALAAMGSNLLFKRQAPTRRSLWIAFALLFIFVAFNLPIVYRLMQFNWTLMKDLPSVLPPVEYINYYWPLQFTLHFSLVFALVFHLVKLCTWNVRRKPKAGAEKAEPTKTNDPTPVLHTN